VPPPGFSVQPPLVICSNHCLKCDVSTRAMQVLAMTLCPSVSVYLSQVVVRTFEMDGRINLVFDLGASFDQSYTVF